MYRYIYIYIWVCIYIYISTHTYNVCIYMYSVGSPSLSLYIYIYTSEVHHRIKSSRTKYTARDRIEFADVQALIFPAELAPIASSECLHLWVKKTHDYRCIMYIY